MRQVQRFAIGTSVPILKNPLALLLFLLAAFGCGGPKADYRQLEMVQATGKVTMDGVPLERAVILFEDLTDETFSYGVTDKEGRYELQFDSEMRGVKVGPKVVRISTTKRLLGIESGAAEEDPDAKPAKKEKVPAKYNSKSELKLVVDKGKATFDFDLESR